MGIDEEFAGIGGRVESEVSFFAGGDDSAEENGFASARAYVERNWSDEGTRHAGLM